MALSLREKLQQASQVSLAASAARTVATLKTMEQGVPRSASENLTGDASVSVSEQPTQSASQQATQPPSQLPSRRPSQLPSHRGNAPKDHPQDSPEDEASSHPKSDPADYREDSPVNFPGDLPEDYPDVPPDFWITLTRRQKSVLVYLLEHQGEIIRYADMARHAGLSIATVQTVCKRFKALGLLVSRYASYGVLKGMRYTLDKSVLAHRLQQNHPGDDPVSDREDDQGRRRPSQPATQSTTHRFGKVLKERQRNLSLSSSVLATTWPNLTRFGFGSAQVDQIVENLTALGKATDRVLQGLDHAEWELEQGKMCDKTGQPVADPCAWVFQSLARTGYYRRPAGYVSAEEQAAKDAEEEARAVVAAQRKAEQAQFEAWRDGLSPEALQNALKGHPGGPRDAWLRNVWKERLAREARRSPGKPGGGTGR